uniref:Uncharacterized protein n=1 Tax=Ditylenchus dipsaci TaxID=166011 RepID=A0A915CPA9_9BILA
MGDNCYEPIGGGDISAVPMAPPPIMIPTPAPKKTAGEKYVPPPPPPVPSSGPNRKSPTEKSMEDLDEFPQSTKREKTNPAMVQRTRKQRNRLLSEVDVPSFS